MSSLVETRHSLQSSSDVAGSVVVCCGWCSKSVGVVVIRTKDFAALFAQKGMFATFFQQTLVLLSYLLCRPRRCHLQNVKLHAFFREMSFDDMLFLDWLSFVLLRFGHSRHTDL